MTFGIRISQQQDMLDLSYRTQVKYLRREIIHGARERQISQRQIRGERFPHTEEVTGSKPVSPTIFTGFSEASIFPDFRLIA